MLKYYCRHAKTGRNTEMSSPLYFFPSPKGKNPSLFSCIKCPQPQEINSCRIYNEKNFHSIKFNILFNMLCAMDKACSFQMTDGLTTIHNKCTTSVLTLLDKVNSVPSCFPYRLDFLTLSSFLGSIFQLLPEPAVCKAAHNMS